MKINSSSFGPDKTTAVMEHKGKTLSWNISILSHAKNEDNLDRFAEINGFWEHLPEARQDQIFNIYENVKDVIHKASTEDEVIYNLQPLVNELFKLNPLSEIGTWLSIYSDLRIPSNVYATYEETGDYRNSLERTYTTSQYRDLVTLSVTLRAMVPIWGDFINLTSGLNGTNFREFMALKLIYDTDLFQAPVVDRLREYIRAFIPEETPKDIFNLGMSSEDFPIWILSRLMILRLVVADLRGTDVKKSLMPFLHTYVNSMVQPRNSNFANMIKEKKAEGNSQNEENNLSILESHRQREELSAGQISKMVVYSRDSLRMAKKICPDIPDELVKQSLETAKKLMMVTIMPVQVTLASWVLKRALPSRAMLYFKNPDVVNCIGVAQALLLHRGHLELAALVSGIPSTADDAFQNLSTGSRGRIPNEMVEEIMALYPLANRPVGKITDATDVRELNMVLQSIKEINKKFSKHTWTLTLAPEYVERLTKNKNDRSYSTPHEMRIRLAALIISLAKRTF